MNTSGRLLCASLVSLAAALACSAPSVQPARTETATPVPPTETATPTPTLAPTPTVAADWQTYQADALKLKVSYPSGWEVSAPEPDTLEIAQTDGDGWLQIDPVNPGVENLFGLSYTAGEGGDAIMAALLAAARQDGAYPDAQSMPTRIGPAAWFSEGQSDIHSEQTLIASIGLADRAIVLTGHGTTRPEDWPALSAVYKGIIASLEAAQ